MAIASFGELAVRPEAHVEELALALDRVGLSGHYVVGRFDRAGPELLDPFAGGVRLAAAPPAGEVRPWGAHETTLRMLNNLLGSYDRRNDIGRAIRAAGAGTTVPAMELSARDRWNARRREGGFEPFPATPSPWLLEHADLLRGPGRALDVACGDGRDALLLAERGYDVDALDVSDVAIDALESAARERGLAIHPRAVDLEREPPPADEYDAVVCFNYLQRDLFEPLQRALRPGGLLVYETLARAHIDELGKRFDPAFVLERNELLRAFAGLHVMHYREGVVERSGGECGVAGIVARRLR